MPTQAAYDRYNDRYDNGTYLAAVDGGLTIDEAVSMQDTALMLCENPYSVLAQWVRDNAKSADPYTTFLALFV